MFLEARLEEWKGAFDTFEVLANEPREVRGVNGHTSHHSGREERSEHLILRTEVGWVRGNVGYLLTLTAQQPAHEDGHPDFEKLIASFRFLDE